MSAGLRRGIELDERDLEQARRFNAMLAMLPRFRTGHRWNARLIQGLLKTAHTLVPDVRRLRSQVLVVTVPGRPVSIRICHPAGLPKGMLIHFHGGAWIMGDARLEDSQTIKIARECKLIVAAVDFRNAIDDDLATTIGDCVAATEWLADNVRRFGVDRLVLSGDSSGAHLALESLLYLHSLGKQHLVKGFYSVCGAFDLEGSKSLRDSSSQSLLISGPSALQNLRRLAPSLPDHLRRGPIHAEICDLPAALFIAGGLDPIVDDSIRMSAKWQRAGGEAKCMIVPEAPHGFHRMPTSVARKTNSFGRRWMTALLEAQQHPTDCVGRI